MEFKWTIGIDVSKKTFDAAYAANAVNAKQAHAVFANDLKGFKAFARWLKEQGVTLTGSLICLENTASTTARSWPICWLRKLSYG